jgi:hypothetical protein
MNYKIFCDESCHLQNDGWNHMILGALRCPENQYEQIKDEIKAIKLKHHTPFEIKWTKLSRSRIPMYKELIDYFIDSNIQYRAVIVMNKNCLDHEKYGQTHSKFYYKTYYLVLKALMNRGNSYKIYMDIKDTHGKKALMELEKVFNNTQELPMPFMQHIRSDESQLLQLSDLLTGAVSYRNRDLTGSDIKLELVNYIEEKLGIRLDMTTSRGYSKFNLFIQDPKRSWR